MRALNIEFSYRTTRVRYVLFAFHYNTFLKNLDIRILCWAKEGVYPIGLFAFFKPDINDDFIKEYVMNLLILGKWISIPRKKREKDSFYK